jgi:hypothetical protein
MLFTKEEEIQIEKAGFDLDALYMAFELLEEEGVSKEDLVNLEKHTPSHPIDEEVSNQLKTPRDARIYLRPFVQWLRDGNLE